MKVELPEAREQVDSFYINLLTFAEGVYIFHDLDGGSQVLRPLFTKSLFLSPVVRERFG